MAPVARFLAWLDVDPHADVRAQLRGDRQHRRVGKLGEQVRANHDGRPRLVPRQPDHTTVPRRTASGATAILPSGPRAARNRPPWRLLPASVAQPAALIGEAGLIAGIVHVRQPQHDRAQSALALGGPMASDPVAGGCTGFHALHVTLPPHTFKAPPRAFRRARSSRGMPAITPFVRTIPSHGHRRRLFAVRGATRVILTAPWRNHVPASVPSTSFKKDSIGINAKAVAA